MRMHALLLAAALSTGLAARPAAPQVEKPRLAIGTASLGLQALANAIVKAERWLETATPDQVADAVPEQYLLGDRALYKQAFENVRTCLSPDGVLQPEAAATVLRLLSAFDPDVKEAKINLDATYDNDPPTRTRGFSVRPSSAAAVWHSVSIERPRSRQTNSFSTRSTNRTDPEEASACPTGTTATTSSSR